MDQKPVKGHFYKQPSEKFYISAGFSDVISTGETIVIGNCSVVAVDKDGTDVTSTVLIVAELAVSGTTGLLVRVKDGTESASPYKITFTCATNLDNEFEVDVEMRIIDL
jgi:hypothetical protein